MLHPFTMKISKAVFFVSLVCFVVHISCNQAEAGIKAGITKEDIVALWLFDDGSGETLKDSSGNGNDGKLIEGPTWDKGKFGGALKFDANKKQRVKVENSDSLNLTDQVSILAWGLVSDTTGNRRFLQKSTEGSDNQYRLLREGGFFRFDAGPGVSNSRVQSPMFKEKEWHHVAGVYDGKTTAIYIDAKQTASQESTGKMKPSDGPLFIGTKHPGAPNGDYWMGMIDEVAIINRAVTTTELAQAMKGFGQILNTTAVGAAGKMATTWGQIKSSY